MQLIGATGRGVAMYAKQGGLPWAPAEPRWWQSGSCHRHFGRSEDFCPLGSEFFGQNRSCSCLKVLGSPSPRIPLSRSCPPKCQGEEAILGLLVSTRK